MVGLKNRFEGKCVIVTGGLGGIGRAVAQRLATEGAAVALVDRSKSELAEADLMARGAVSARSYAADVADEARVREVCEAVVSDLGGFDAVVNVAGMMIYKPLEELTSADWLSVLSVNLLGPAHFTANALRLMSSGGAIVNIASIHAFQTSPLVAPYAAAKAGLLSLTRSTAIEGKARGVRANAILPGAIDTPMLWDSPNIKSGAEVLEPDDVGQPEDIAAAAAFLASDEARFINGAGLNIEGGRLAKL